MQVGFLAKFLAQHLSGHALLRCRLMICSSHGSFQLAERVPLLGLDSYFHPLVSATPTHVQHYEGRTSRSSTPPPDWRQRKMLKLAAGKLTKSSDKARMRRSVSTPPSFPPI